MNATDTLTNLPELGEEEIHEVMLYYHQTLASIADRGSAENLGDDETRARHIFDRFTK